MSHSGGSHGALRLVSPLAAKTSLRVRLRGSGRGPPAGGHRAPRPARRQSPPIDRLAPPLSLRRVRRLPGAAAPAPPRRAVPASSCQRGARRSLGRGRRRAAPSSSSKAVRVAAPDRWALRRCPGSRSPSIISCDWCWPAPHSAAMLAARPLSGICRLRRLSQSGLQLRAYLANGIPVQG